MGPYPWSLKQRLISRHGHLSNAAVGRFLRTDYDGRARHLILAHLSEHNNLPELALGAHRTASGRDYPVHLAGREGVSPLLEV
jgi:phosphoribosyl 1,2-cyclic phosphodiesterase